MPPILEAAELRKVYQIHDQESSSIKEAVISALGGRLGAKREFAALEGLTLAVEPGASLGILGPNGSGKSTFLKLAAGVMEPTSGRITVRGRVASLLELGAGFQHEFTGMENIFLQGSLLGLTRGQILERLGRIVDFSGLGAFIHTPVKRYSTGMIVRLGFAIAAFAEADILLVDEVLSVGDAAFQTRSLERIAELRRAGRTLLFVTHELGLLDQMADHALWLERGRVRMMGEVDDVLRAYEECWRRPALEGDPSRPLDELSAALSATARQGTGDVQIRGVELRDAGGNPVRRFRAGDDVQFILDVHSSCASPVEFQAWLGVGNPRSERVALCASAHPPEAPACGGGGASAIGENGIGPAASWRLEPDQSIRIVARPAFHTLTPGAYILSCAASGIAAPHVFYDVHLRLYRFIVEPDGGASAPRASMNPACACPLNAVMYAPAIWETPAEGE